MKIYSVDTRNKMHIIDFKEDMYFLVKCKFIVKNYTNDYLYNMTSEIYNLFGESRFLFFSFA